jgi:hypothetical protein
MPGLVGSNVDRSLKKKKKHTAMIAMCNGYELHSSLLGVLAKHWLLLLLLPAVSLM